MSVDRDDESIVFAQVDANLDTNPKIRKAGAFGRQVFEFVLRRNALRGFKGNVPIAFIDADYLADQLMIAPADAVTGVTKAVTAKLIEVDLDYGTVSIVGWHSSWGKRAKEGKERTREYRERIKAKQQALVTTGDACDETPSQVTTGDKSDAREEKRREEIKETHTRVRERHPDAGLIARRVWDHGAKVCGELSLAKVKPLQIWPTMAGADHPGWQMLLDRVCELLVGSTPDEAEKVARNRVDVAKAKALDDGDGQWFSPTAMFSPNSFAHWSTLDPTLVGRKRAGPQRAAAPGALIGAATPRTDHPESETLRPFGEL